MVVGQCGRFWRLATQLQQPESLSNKRLNVVVGSSRRRCRCVSTVNSTYVAIPAILPFCHSFRRTAIPSAIPPFDHSHHLTFYFPQRLSAFRHIFPIFLSGFPIFLNGFPFSKKFEKIYLRPVLGKRTCSTHHGRLRVQQQRGGGEQRGNGVCSVVLATAALWQRRQKQHGSSAVEASSAEMASAARC